MTIAQQEQIRELTGRVATIETLFREGAEQGNSRTRMDNLESTVSGILLELQRLSKALTPTEAAKEPQDDSKWQNPQTTKSAASSAIGSAVRSAAATANSGTSAPKR